MLLVETHLKFGHADVNHEHWEALKHVRKENLGYEEPYCDLSESIFFFLMRKPLGRARRSHTES